MSEDDRDQIRETIPADEWWQREVYAQFGLAIYFCQVLETQLINYLALLRRGSGGQSMTVAEVDALFERLFAGTLGRNLREVRDLLGDDWELADEMAGALKLRNDLVHHWMRDRALKQGTNAKRRAVVEELEGARARLQEADEKLTARTMTLWERLGISREEIDREYERLRKLADREDPPQPDPTSAA